MKKLFLILSFGLLNYAYGQTYPGLEKVLTKELSKDSQGDGGWVFYADKAKIEKVDKPLIKAALPNYDFFQVTLTNFLGYHVNQGTCLVLYDSSKAKIMLVEPLWYGDVNERFIKLFINRKFTSKDSLLNFFKEVNDLMEIGSGYKFINTNFSTDSVNYDLGYFKGDSYTTGGNGTSSTVNYNQDGVWRKIKLDIKSLKIIRYASINPKTNDKEIIE